VHIPKFRNGAGKILANASTPDFSNYCKTGRKPLKPPGERQIRVRHESKYLVYKWMIMVIFCPVFNPSNNLLILSF
jgi:hypothetical protein